MKYFFCLVSILFLQTVKGQDSLSNPAREKQRVFGIHYLWGKVLVHNHDVQSIENAKPKGFSLDFTKQAIDSVSYAYARNYVRRGIAFTFYDLGTPILGKANI